METMENNNNMTFGEKIKNFFVNPGKLFEKTGRKPKVGILLVVIGVISLIATMLIFNFTKDYIIKVAIENAANKNPEQAELIANSTKAIMNSPFGIISTVIAALVSVYALTLFVSLIYWLGAKMFSGECTYKQVLYVYCVSYITILISYIYEVSYSVINKMPSTGQATTILQQFANSINLFALWQLVILTYGLSAVSKIGKGKSAAIVLVVYAAQIGISVGYFALTHR